MKTIPLPEKSRTYVPVSHAIFIDEIKEELYKRGHSVSKKHSARKFRKNVGRTKAVNMKGPMRGGIRL